VNITAVRVKELRERTGAGMMECKQALIKANGDVNVAIDILRKAGRAKAAKKGGRIAAEGIIAVKISNDEKTAIMIEVNTETDFASRDEQFKEFVNEVVTLGLENEVTDLSGLLKLKSRFEGGSRSVPTVAEECEALIAKIGENIQIRRMALVKSDGIVGNYCHAGRIGVLVDLSVRDLQLGKDIAMHIAASKPEVTDPHDLPAEIIDKEKEIYQAEASETGKPKEIVEKMVAGRIRKFIDEVSLVKQPFIKDPTVTVGDLLKKLGAKVLFFVRFEVGEGIEKQKADFAKEVMSQIKRKS
jgi:elongation factor Ts